MVKRTLEITGAVRTNEPLRLHTTFRIGGPCGRLAEPVTEEDIRAILRFARARGMRIFILGGGSNVLAPDAGFKGIVMRLGGRRFRSIRFAGTSVTAGAGAKLSTLIHRSCQRGLGGLEGLAGVPGTVGGAISMNAGYKSGIRECLEEVTAMRVSDGAITVMRARDIRFGYRQSNLNGFIILSAKLRLKITSKERLQKKRRVLLREKMDRQPLGAMSAGCVFKNPAHTSAARYIDELGLKGARRGDAMVSRAHANFIVNVHYAKANDVRRLMRHIQRRVKKRFNVDLKPEIVFM
jgi:UDP-N-acetylmuramate dehydrogenase